jgi:hypothetical protein
VRSNNRNGVSASGRSAGRDLKEFTEPCPGGGENGLAGPRFTLHDEPNASTVTSLNPVWEIRDWAVKAAEAEEEQRNLMHRYAEFGTIGQHDKRQKGAPSRPDNFV